MSDSSKSEKEKDIISNIRAIIISCKGGLRIADVENDYWEAFGEKIPLREMGYTGLRNFFLGNPSDFYLFGDMVDVVMKSSSAHIRSLVSRQKNNRTRSSKKGTSSSGVTPRQIWIELQPRSWRKVWSSIQIRSPVTPDEEVNVKQPKKRQTGPSIPFVAPPRFKKENPASTPKGSQVNNDAIEKITLRKPKTCILEWIRPELVVHHVQKTKDTANTKQLPLKTESVANVGNRGKSTKAQPQEPTKYAAKLGSNTNYTDTFQNIEDLPVETFSQSRLLRLKSKIAQELKPLNSDEGSDASTKSSVATDMFFDTKSISSAPPNLISSNESSSVTNQIAIQSNYKNQKAQARIAQLQQTMQAKVQNMNLPSNEVNNNKTDTCNLRTEVSNEKAIKQEHFFEGSMNGRPKMDPLKTTTDYVGSDSTLLSQNNQMPMTDNSIYVQLLRELCNSRGFYDPAYKIMVREEINEPKNYICKVQIEDYLQMSSYPIETRDPLSAKELAAKKMYNYCISDETFRKKNKKEETLISRILDIVSSTYGVWSDKLPILYNNVYQEKLPDDWFNIISKSPLFEMETYDVNRCIVRKKTERSIMDIETLQRFKGIEMAEAESQKFRDLPDLELPKSVQWAVYITNVVNSDEVWCRLIGEHYSDAYDSMMIKLELEPPLINAKKPKIGGLYSVKVSAVWYRIRLMEWVNENEALAFYIDIGDKDVVKISNLYEPEEIFFSVAPQAVTLSLFELGCFSDDDEITSYVTENLLGKTYIGEIITEVGNSESTTRRIVRLWDTSTEQDINVNQMFINNIIKSIRAPSLPLVRPHSFTKSFHIRDVVVTSVSDNGEIHVQTEQKSVYRLNCIILNKIKSMGDEFIQRKTHNTIGTDILYLTRYTKNGKYCRVKLTEILNVAMVDVLFIDYGFVQRKAITDLIHLEKTSILQAIPAQAIKVKLGNVLLPDETIVTKLRETVLNQTTLMKVVSFNQGGLPAVEFFKRSSGDNLLYSINTEIKDGSKLIECSTPTRRKSVVFGLERVLPKNLPGPDLPEIGQHFEVFVTLASSPDLFIVQPLSYRRQFMKLMNELQKMFADGYASMAMEQDIIVGELYAVLHPDGNWYRGCAQAVVGSYSYSIYMCDFGDCIMVTRDKIMPLPEPFKFFPYQAIRATLQGIPPEYRDWTPLDCITFHKLVVEKYFVSTVMEINRDERNPNYLSLSLILTDTSRDEDVYIHKVLMDMKNEGCAFVSL